MLLTARFNSSKAAHRLRALGARSATTGLAGLGCLQSHVFSSGVYGTDQPKPNIDQLRIPSGAWDSHVHVLDPRFPLSKDAQYKPYWHTLRDWTQFSESVGILNAVFVQPSIYGNDNSCLLDALKILGSNRSRGIVTFDPLTTPLSTLQEWDMLGVRGVRVNLVSVGKAMEKDELANTLQTYAAALRPLKWVIEIYLPMNMMLFLESILPELGVVVCIDHMGHPLLDGLFEYMTSEDPSTIPGFDAMLRLLKDGRTYVKLSGAYRMATAADGVTDVIPMAKALLRTADQKVVFATDWPHTRYEGLDIRPWIQSLLEICGSDEALIKQLFKSNAEKLWGVKNDR
ncbi:hypothetical protein NUW58_g6459 [Xylaria curta]|uniref:Uncharacterized protein n=1 Tax=Xylaria curta TaxID=42375 RepID=A0ACC1NT94_9PEZI|nr:hypothetical protein NUW58_g6459 [Xylaria curta]